jgi:hypothetical protein
MNRGWKSHERSKTIQKQQVWPGTFFHPSEKEGTCLWEFRKSGVYILSPIGIVIAAATLFPSIGNIPRAAIILSREHVRIDVSLSFILLFSSHARLSFCHTLSENTSVYSFSCSIRLRVVGHRIYFSQLKNKLRPALRGNSTRISWYTTYTHSKDVGIPVYSTAFAILYVFHTSAINNIDLFQPRCVVGNCCWQNRFIASL